MAMGRLENAVVAVEKAWQIDPRNGDVNVKLYNVRAVAKARVRGNELFNLGNYVDACIAYGEGLKYDPSNPILHCNRVACHSKLKQWQRSVDDYNVTLRIHPKYTKSLLRRAACNAKPERWVESVRDYEVLRKELPEDKEVAENSFHAQVALRTSRVEEVSNMKFGGEVEQITGRDQFKGAISLPVFCKYILHEYTAKMHIEQPIYTFVESKGLFLRFITLVSFDGKTYTGSIGRIKKRAEQIAAPAVIESILASDTGNTMPQIIKSKSRFYGAIGEGHGSCIVQDIGLSGNGDNYNGDNIVKAKAMISAVANESSTDISNAEPLSSRQHAKALPFELKNLKEVPDLLKLCENDECPGTFQRSDPTVAYDSKIGCSKTRKCQGRGNRACAKRARADRQEEFSYLISV